MAIPSFDPSIKVQKAVRVLGLDWLGLHSLPLPSLRDIVTIPGKCLYLIGEKWRQTQKGHQQKKNVEKAESKGCEDEMSTSCQHAKQAESIDGARSGDSSKPVGDTSQNDIEKKQPDVKTPKTYRKIGQQRQVLKKGALKLQPKSGRNHGGSYSWYMIFMVLGSFFGTAVTSSVPSTEITPTTEPGMMETLPTACTDAGSKRNDTWLDKNDVESTTNSGVFDGSNRGYTNICPNAFDGLRLSKIVLTGNNITELPDGLFRNVLRGLHRVYLDNNRLTLFPVALNGLRDIEEIGISYNNIREIPRGEISTDTSLISLDVSGNINLCEVPKDTFFLANLQAINLSNTAISSPPYPPCLSLGMNKNYSLKCGESHVDIWRGKSKLTIYLQNTCALCQNWKLKNCADPEEKYIHSECTTSISDPIEKKPTTTATSYPNVIGAKSVLNSSVSDDPSWPKSEDNEKNSGDFILLTFAVMYAIFILSLKGTRMKMFQFPNFVMVGLYVGLIILFWAIFFAALKYFGILLALAFLVVNVAGNSDFLLMNHSVQKLISYSKKNALGKVTWQKVSQNAQETN